MLKKLLIILSACLFTMSNGEIQSQTYPQSYKIELIFRNFDSTSYNGRNTINIKILEDTDSITLHSSNINVTNVTLLELNITLPYIIERERELLIILNEDGKKFKSNEIVQILIVFNVEIKESPTTQGVYHGKYLKENLPKHFLATHTRPGYARQVFPCYDDPNIKSVFNLEITHLPNYHSISNMDELPSENNGTENPYLLTTTFKQTPLMPAYLLSFFISDFESNEHKISRDGPTIRVFSQPNRIEETNFGFLTAVAAYKSFERYFDAPQMLDKLDQVILPQLDFGGIESQGIIFYDANSFLFDENNDDFSKKEFLSRNIVNDFCKIFIRSSPTYDSESTIWLNKGLCKFYEYQITDSIYPEMMMSDLFIIEVMETEMNRDPSDTNKELIAASVIRMFNHALSEETFKQGLQNYIKKITLNPEGIEPKDFYDALQISVNDSALNVAGMFETWKTQTGYPIVHVTRNYNGNNVRFTQEPFVKEFNALWSIPITYSSNSISQQQFWLLQSEEEVTIEELSPSDYFIVNINQTGYYRVMYDDHNWALIAKELNEEKFENISPNTRAMLIDDASKFMQKDILRMEIFLDIIKYLRLETDYIPWMSATNNLLYMRRMLNDGSSKLDKDFQKFIQNLFTNVFKTYGVTESSDYEHYEKHIQNTAINWACQARLPLCLTETAEFFNREIVNSEVTISTDHKATIMCNGAILGNFTTFNYFWNLYENSNQASEKSMILKSIGCIERKDVLSYFITQYANVNKDEWFTVIQAVYSNGPTGMKVAMEFLNDKFAEFNRFIKNRNAYDSLELIFQEIAERVITDETFKDFINLMDKYSISAKTTESLNAIIKENLEWIKKNSPIIDKFLNSSRMVTVSLSVILFGYFVQYFVR